MRTTIVASAALIAGWLAYAASPYFAVYDLLRIVQERNLAELRARVDFPAVRRSLTAQIVRTYLRITGKTGQSGSIAEQLGEQIAANAKKKSRCHGLLRLAPAAPTPLTLSPFIIRAGEALTCRAVMSGIHNQLEFFITGSLKQLIPDEHVLVRVDRVLN
jgi:hypothetical protein